MMPLNMSGCFHSLILDYLSRLTRSVMSSIPVKFWHSLMCAGVSSVLWVVQMFVWWYLISVLLVDCDHPGDVESCRLLSLMVGLACPLDLTLVAVP